MHNFRKILINDGSSDSNHLSKLSVLVVVAFTKRKETEQQTQPTHNLLVSNLVFVRESCLFCI